MELQVKPAQLVFDDDDNRPSRLGKWKFVSELAFGAVSRVYMVEHEETHQKCVDKYYDMRELNRRLFTGGRTAADDIGRELAILNKCHHPNVLRPLFCFEDRVTSTFHFILPYASHGSLQKICENGHGPHLQCFYQIAQGLEYLHNLGIVHRDIKPSNILCQKPDAFVLSDFSDASRLEGDSLLVDTKGSPAFLSPEELKGGKFNGKKADVWSYGVTMFWSVFGIFPFGIGDLRGQEGCLALIAIRECVNNNDLILPESSGIGQLWRELLAKCLNKQPDCRPSFQQITGDPLFYALSRKRR
jgi:serine/threonine protein kinase